LSKGITQKAIGNRRSAQGKKEGGSFSTTYEVKAIQADSGKPVVLLIDEIDRSDEEFEAFLLEVLSDFQVTIPEIGTLKAKHRPLVILTSNRTRELHDALKRRCLYHWIDYPSLEKERRIVLAKVPGVNQTLLNQVCASCSGCGRGFYSGRESPKHWIGSRP
jgi:MoxR-like ATPase